MSPPLATVAFVPREVFSTTQRSLESLLTRTKGEYNLVCVDGNSPPRVRDYLAEQARRHNFTLLRSETYLSPNQARNLALNHVHTKYVAFVENDVIFSHDWLQPLVQCAEETGAWVVGPLYFEHEPEETRIHMAGGECHIETDAEGRRSLVDRHYLPHVLLRDVTQPLERMETGHIEFHAALVSMEAIRELGPLDEGFMSIGEYLDLCLAVLQAGHKVYLEPRSRITYVPPKTLAPEDREFFFLRWSEAWTAATISRLYEKWNLDPASDWGANAPHWVAGHRRYGLRHLRWCKRLFGAKWTRSLEKRVSAPLERMLNRYTYPAAKFGRSLPFEAKVLHAGAASQGCA